MKPVIDHIVRPRGSSPGAEVLARAERDHVEAVAAGANGVRLVEVLVDDAIARTDLVGLVVEQRQP